LTIQQIFPARFSEGSLRK